MANQTLTTESLNTRAPCFVYGSLMSPKILYSVIGAEKPLTPRILRANQMIRATLHGHQRHAVKWADFPAVMKTGNRDDFVEGYLVTGLTEKQEERIKIFESGLYTQEDVSVVTGWKGDAMGEERKARVYIWARESDELVDIRVRVWNFGEFKESSMYSRGFGIQGSDGEEEG